MITETQLEHLAIQRFQDTGLTYATPLDLTQRLTLSQFGWQEF